MNIVRDIEIALVSLMLLVCMVSYQYSQHALDEIAAAEHAELVYLRAWRKVNSDNVKVEKQQDQCLQDAFKMLKPFLAIPMEPSPEPKKEGRGLIT